MVCTFTVVGTHYGPLGPFPATGNEFTLPLCEMWHFTSVLDSGVVPTACLRRAVAHASQGGLGSPVRVLCLSAVLHPG
jgi:hypothetical protein